jgi:C_GCAxxG_C_C family probable redox protein
MNKQEIALNYFNNKFNCSQAVFTSFGIDLGLSEDECLKISCAFGGGMGRQQFTCGAVTGALMVLGLKYGKAFKDEDSKKTETYAKTVEFLKEFEKLNGSTTCKVLLQNLDMNNENDLAKINELNLFKVNCEKYVTDAVMLLEKI